MTQNPTVGRIVHYRLTADEALSARRRHREAYIGNRHYEGDVVPLLIVKVWPNVFPYAPEGVSKDGVNGQAFLDGNDAVWVTSAGEGDGPRQWSWPPRS